MSELAPEIADPAPATVALELSYRSAGSFLMAYATNLAKGVLFVETATPLPIGTLLALTLHAPPDVVVSAEGVVAWSRGVAAGPGHPAGMGVALSTLPDTLGEVVDRLAFGFTGIKILLDAGEAAPRAILSRYLRSILTCEIIEVDVGADVGVGVGDEHDREHDHEHDHDHDGQRTGAARGQLGKADLVVIDLDSSGARGLALYQRLRAGPPAPSAPAIALAQLDRDRARALHVGFDDAIANPPPFNDLQAAVLRSLAKPMLVR
jgi:uncharacterized protein (TIGR02266 family)